MCLLKDQRINILQLRSFLRFKGTSFGRCDWWKWAYCFNIEVAIVVCHYFFMLFECFIVKHDVNSDVHANNYKMTLFSGFNKKTLLHRMKKRHSSEISFIHLFSTIAHLFFTHNAKNTQLFHWLEANVHSLTITIVDYLKTTIWFAPAIYAHGMVCDSHHEFHFIEGKNAIQE